MKVERGGSYNMMYIIVLETIFKQPKPENGKQGKN